MCIAKKQLEEKIEDWRSFKILKEEVENNLRAVEHEIISYMVENNLTEEITATAKVTYKPQTRSTLNKEQLEKDLGDLSEYTKKTTYNVLRIK